jgi:hypothetical protein
MQRFYRGSSGAQVVVVNLSCHFLGKSLELILLILTRKHLVLVASLILRILGQDNSSIN